MNSTNYNLITVLGPTASGKTSLAAHVAYRLDSAVISADSRQIYKTMDIGTGKDYNDYFVENVYVPYFLIDTVDAGDKYNLFEYQKDFFRTYKPLYENKKIPVLCGGSGLYIEAVLNAYRMLSVPVNECLRIELETKTVDQLARILASYGPLHNKTDIDTRKRVIRAIEIAEYQKDKEIIKPDYPEINSLIIGIHYERDLQKQKITERLHERLRSGMVEEVQHLLESGISPEDLIYYGLEYKFITLYLTGKLRYDEMINLLNIAIHQFSKRQMTWFRKMERDGFTIHWLDGFLPLETKVDKVLKLLKNLS
jgi:tRNA dimethylallyltransferase